jgi:fucose permease
MGIFNKGAGIIAPLLFAAVILKATDTDLFSHLATMNEAEKNQALDELVQRVIIPYVCVGTVLFGLGLMIRYSPLPEINTDRESIEVIGQTRQENHIPVSHLILGAVAIFLHVGTQVIAIDTIIGYANSMNVSLMEAKSFPSYTLFATICGYTLGIITIPKYISQVNALRSCTVLGYGVYVAHYLHTWTGCFFRPRYRSLHLVCCFIRVCQLTCMGRHLAISIRWPGQVYQARRFDHDHGLMWQRYSSAFVWLAG